MAGGWSSKQAKPIRAWVGGIHFETLVTCMGTPPRTQHTEVTLVMISCARRVPGLVFMWCPDSSSIPWLPLFNIASTCPEVSLLWKCADTLRLVSCLFYCIERYMCVHILTFVWMHSFFFMFIYIHLCLTEQFLFEIAYP